MGVLQVFDSMSLYPWYYAGINVNPDISYLSLYFAVAIIHNIHKKHIKHFLCILCILCIIKRGLLYENIGFYEREGRGRQEYIGC